jgi:hypothetical protein
MAGPILAVGGCGDVTGVTLNRDSSNLGAAIEVRLKLLTWLETRPANQGASQRQEGLVNMSVAFVATLQESKRVKPCNRALD